MFVFVTNYSDSSMAIKTGGCFPGHSIVHVKNRGPVKMDALAIGDQVLSVDVTTGQRIYEPVIGFLHRSETEPALFQTVQTEKNTTLTLTPDHLIYSSDDPADPGHLSRPPLFAGRLKIGSFVYVMDTTTSGSNPVRARVTDISRVHGTGLYAPLTASGTMVVDDVIVSCYALVDSHVIAHATMTPLRIGHRVKEFFREHSIGVFDYLSAQSTEIQGVHWYADLMRTVGSWILPDSFWFRDIR